MYFVGIDISKFKHDCAIIDELGDVITSFLIYQYIGFWVCCQLLQRHGKIQCFHCGKMEPVINCL